MNMQRAFVIQFRRDIDPSEDQFAGKVEHVLSGQVTHFATLAEFLQFVAKVLPEDTGDTKRNCAGC